jgi:hypothetical protein
VPQGATTGWSETFDARRIVDAAALLAIAASTLAWIAYHRRRA